MQSQISERQRSCDRRVEDISLLTAWVRESKPFGYRPPFLLTARFASDAINLANQLDMDLDGALTIEDLEFHARAYLLVMLAGFYSIVDEVAKAIGVKTLEPAPLRKVCERAAVRTLLSARSSALRDDLCRSSIGLACSVLDKRAHS